MPIRVMLALAVVTVLAQVSFLGLPGGLGHFQSDYAAAVIIAEQFRHGPWTAFHWDMTYAGTLFTVLKSVWASVCEPVLLWVGLLPDDAFLRTYLFFSFGVMPILLSWAMGFFLLSTFPGQAGLITSFLAAIGLRFLDSHLPNEVYLSNLILGCVLLGIRSRLPKGALSLSRLELWLAGLLSGVALYESRISMLFVLPFWVDLGPVLRAGWQELRIDARQQAFDRLGRSIAWALVGLWLWLELMGPQFGAWKGKPIKLHATPNLAIAFWVLVIFKVIRWFRYPNEARPLLSWLTVRRGKLCAAGLGIFTGMVPEILSGWSRSGIGKQPIGIYSFQDSMTIVGLLPLRFREILGDVEEPAGFALPLAFFLLLIPAVRRIARGGRLQPYVWTGLLSLAAYLRIYTGMAWATPRYLLPFLPVAFALMALGLQELRSSYAASFWKPVMAGVLALFFVHAAWTMHSRARFAAVDSVRFLARGERILDRFRDAGVDVVMTDIYEETNQYTMLARGRIIFGAQTFPKPLTHPEFPERLARAQRAGVLILDPAHVSGRLAGWDWQLKPLGEVDGRLLFLAERKLPGA